MMMNDELLHAGILKWYPKCFLPCVFQPPGSWPTTPLWPTHRSSPEPWGKPESSPTTSLWAWGKYQAQIPILKCSHTRRCLHFHGCLYLTLTLVTLLFTSTVFLLSVPPEWQTYFTSSTWQSCRRDSSSFPSACYPRSWCAACCWAWTCALVCSTCWPSSWSPWILLASWPCGALIITLSPSSTWLP